MGSCDGDLLNAYVWFPSALCLDCKYGSSEISQGRTDQKNTKWQGDKMESLLNMHKAKHKYLIINMTFNLQQVIDWKIR